MSVQSAIEWPQKYLPGTTDNFVSNEVIVKDISAETIWSYLSDISKWTSYYHNCKSITEPPSGPILKQGETFKFSTFGLPVLPARVEESIAPSKGQAGRIAWSARMDGDEDSAIDVYHAWLVEDLDGGRVRILTQESQIGKPAAELAAAKPNKMLLGHQDWCDGLIRAARGQKGLNAKDTNLGPVA